MHFLLLYSSRRRGNIYNKKENMATLPPPPPPPKPKSKTNQNANHNNYVSSEHTNSYNGNNGHSSLPPLTEEKVVMTPKGKTSNSTVILIERKLIDSINERQHVAGGDHTGIIINKDTHNGLKSQHSSAQLVLEFRVFLVSGNTGQHSQESRTLRFWFRSWLTDGDKQAHIAQDFFRELVSPKEFPRGIKLLEKILLFLLNQSSFINNHHFQIMLVSLKKL